MADALAELQVVEAQELPGPELDGGQRRRHRHGRGRAGGCFGVGAGHRRLNLVAAETAKHSVATANGHKCGIRGISRRACACRCGCGRCADERWVRAAEYRWRRADSET